jgi:hypothetical protein
VLKSVELLTPHERGIFKQEVKTSIQPTMTVYHCGMGYDNCQELQNYLNGIKTINLLEEIKEILR